MNGYRRKHRSARRGKKRALGVSVAIFCALALVFVGAYYVKQYRHDLMYARYPLHYKEEIVQYAAQYELDPALVSALVFTESSFAPKAESNVGARGLMQIMPDTGEWIAFRLGEEFNADDLNDPDFNLRYGCWYLMFLMKKYDGNVQCVAAAYHAGSGAVDEWLTDPAYSSDGKTLSDIPYPQTAIYASTIMERYEIYASLYNFDAA